MKRGKQSLLGIFLFLFSVQSTFGQEKTYFSDSTSFFEFLSNQGQVPGLKFRYSLPPDFKIPKEDTLYWKKSELGFWLSNSFDSVTQVTRFKSSFDSLKLSNSNFEYLIYGESSTEEAASEFVSALLRSNDIFPLEKKTSRSLDLVLLAQDLPFEPGFDIGFGYFTDFKIFMIALVMSVFLILAGGMILFMIIFKSIRYRKEKLKEQFTIEITPPLSQILFNYTRQEILNLEANELDNYFPSNRRTNTLYNEVLIENIISLNKKMKGEFKEKLKALFKRLELNKISEAKIKSKKWDVIVSGLVQVNEMDLEEYLPEVKNHLDSSNFHVRSNAAATLLNLSREVDLSFLKNQKYPLSNWQQMTYLRIIKFLYPTRKLLMSNLFDSDNLSVRLFGYKLVRMVGRVDLVENLGSIAENATHEEKIEILKTIDSIGVPGYTDLINSSMKSSNFKLSKQALKVAGNLGDQRSIDVILELLHDNPRFEKKMLLLENLKSLNPQSYESFIEKTTDKETKAISLHLSDPLLNHV